MSVVLVRFRPESPPGPTERAVRQAAWRLGLGFRAVTVALAGAFELVAIRGGGDLPASGIVVGAMVWCAAASLVSWNGPRPVVVAADLVVATVICLTRTSTVPVEHLHDGANWVNVASVVTAAVYQACESRRLRTFVVLLGTATQVVAVDSAGGNAAWVDAVAVAAWVPITAVLVRALFVHLLGGARTADAAIERTATARHVAAVAAARRADEREYLALLHDTAAATLLAAGQGSAAADRTYDLAGQARRALSAITAWPDGGMEAVEFGRLLAAVVAASRLDVELTGVIPQLPASSALALSRAVGEALENVVRHAGVTAASVTVELDGDLLVVDIGDDGRGFVPDAVPAGCRGLRESVVERVRRVGGSVEVVSAPGTGTRVRLSVVVPGPVSASVSIPASAIPAAGLPSVTPARTVVNRLP